MLPSAIAAPASVSASASACNGAGVVASLNKVGTTQTVSGNGNGKKVQRKRKRWTANEEACLWAGVQKHGVGAWSIILADSDYSFDPQRTAVDLKDKWRVLTVRRPPTAPPPPIDPSTLPRAPPPNKRAREVSPERANRTIAVAAAISPAAEAQSSPLPTPASSSRPASAQAQPESSASSPAAAEELRGRSRSRSTSLSPMPPASVWSSIHSDWFASFSALPPPDALLTGPACSLLPDDLHAASIDPLGDPFSIPTDSSAAPGASPFPSGSPAIGSSSSMRFPLASPTNPAPSMASSLSGGNALLSPPETPASTTSFASNMNAAPMCPFSARLAAASTAAELSMSDPLATSSDVTHEFEYHDYSAEESNDEDELVTDSEWSMPAMAQGEPLFPFAGSPMADQMDPPLLSSPTMDRLHHSTVPEPLTDRPCDSDHTSLVPRRALHVQQQQPMVWNPARFFGAFNPPTPSPSSSSPPPQPADSRTALKAELTDAITRARIAGEELKAHHESIVLRLTTSSGRSVQHVPQADLFNCRHHPKVDHRVMPRLRPNWLAWRPRSVSPIASPRVRPLDARPLAQAVMTAKDPAHAAMAKANSAAGGRKRGRSEPAPVARRQAAGRRGQELLAPLGEEGPADALIPHAISEATDLALSEMLDAALQLDESTRTAALRLLGNRAFARNSSRLESLAFRALRLTTTDILKLGMHPAEETLPDDPVAAAAAVKPSEHMYARIKKGHSHMQAKLLQAAAANGTRALTNG